MSEREAKPDLQPTLWRTCRVLANRTRLRILREVIRSSSLSVTDVADKLEMSDSTASEYLRMLNARGLLAAKRKGAWVYYTAKFDPSVSGAKELLAALKIDLQPSEKSIESVFRLITGFTHPRRIQIVRTLSNEAMHLYDLQAKTGIYLDSLKRHLFKLEDRGYITSNEKQVYSLVAGKQSHKTAEVLLAIALR